MSIEPAKRFDQDPGEFAAFGRFRLIPGARLLERDGVPVELGGRALDILIELVKQAGKVVSRTDLMSSVWPIGKTTVAVAAGHALLAHFGGAVRFIELGSLTDPARVATTVASTLGIDAFLEPSAILESQGEAS